MGRVRKQSNRKRGPTMKNQFSTRKRSFTSGTSKKLKQREWDIKSIFNVVLVMIQKGFNIILNIKNKE